MVYRSSSFLDRQEAAIAASLGVTTALPAGWVSYRPVSHRVFIKIRRNKKGILVKVVIGIATIVEHRKAHVEVVRARLRELHLISDFIDVLGENRLSIERPLLGCR